MLHNNRHALFKLFAIVSLPLNEILHPRYDDVDLAARVCHEHGCQTANHRGDVEHDDTGDTLQAEGEYIDRH